MSEFRFFVFTDFEYSINNSQNILNSPFKLYKHPATSALTSNDEQTTELNVPYTVFEILVAIFAIIGNLMVIIVFQRERKLRRRTNYYIVSLAIADFLVGLLGIPFAILASVGLPTNFHACLFTVSLLVVLCTISIFCLVAVSVDRYWAILYPMAYSRNVRTRTAIGIISMCWVAGTIVGFLPLFGWHAGDHHQACLFVEVMDYNYLVFLYFATIITPALLMLAFYAHIYRVIIKQVRQIVTMNPVIDSSRRSSTVQIQMPTTNAARRPMQGGTMLRVLGAARKRDVKATQNLSIIVVFFMICWIPLYTINCIKAFSPDFFIHPKLTLFCIILSHLNSAVNPVLYAYHLKDFRAALKSLILKVMGIEIEPPIDTMHRFSLASQHRLQSIDVSVQRALQPKIYIDSPIWLRQQQQQSLKNSGMVPKCGVVQPYLNNINQTAAAVASVTSELERDMWNIMEASSGAEKCDVHYDFQDSKNNSTSTPTPPPRKHRKSQQRDGGYDSPYSYENRNYSANPEEADFEEVFLPSSNKKIDGVDHRELQQSLIACAMREKLRSDDNDFQMKLHSNRSRLTDSSYSDMDVSRDNSSCNSPANGKLNTHNGSANTLSHLPTHTNSNSCLAVSSTANEVYVIESDTNPLSPGHKPRFKKSPRLQVSAISKSTRQISRSYSCNAATDADAQPATTTTSRSPAHQEMETGTGMPSTPTHSNTSTSSNSLSIMPESGQTSEPTAVTPTTTITTSNKNNNNTQTTNNLNYFQVQHTAKATSANNVKQQNSHHICSPFKTVGNLIFPPIAKHSSLFHLFQTDTNTNTNTKSTLTRAASVAKANNLRKSLDLESASAELDGTLTLSTTTVTTTNNTPPPSLLTVNES